jgi:glyoxylase-like metal-dependent hydrolase (beta-lactamase superfamily II)
MTLIHSFSVGALRCHVLEAGLQHLDGGAMFGVVPRPLWQKRIMPDERNRIPLSLRCLLVEHPAGLVLIDTGIGNKEDQRFTDIYGVENTSREGRPTQLEDALAEAGYAPADVRWVINTHLHFDHAGGNTVVGRPGGQTVSAVPESSDRPAPRPSVALAFPNATYVVQRAELEFARQTNERTRASYLPPNFEPVAEALRWQLLMGSGEILPGIAARLTPGHVPYHQSVLVHDGPEAALFLGDVIPTSLHLPLPWIMGYDLEPMRTLESKRALLREAAGNGWLLVFGHDAEVVLGRATMGPKEVELTDVVHRTTR